MNAGIAAILIALILAPLAFVGCSDQKSSRETIAYCAQDQQYAEPIFHDFEKATALKVPAVYDNEAVKTVGLANRLFQEQAHPQCDVFWGNEEMRTRQLAAKNVFRPTNGWAAFGYRSRRIVINTNLLPLTSAPTSLLELVKPEWNGKVALAYPQFGTTATHFHALRQLWGDAQWEKWCRALAANKPFLVDGNSSVVDMVGKGAALVGLTDSDDIAAGREKGYPLAALPMNHETLLLPNTVAVVRGCPHVDAAEQLFLYLQQPAVTEQLVAAKALEGASAKGLSAQTLKVDWDSLLRDLEPVTKRLNEIFLR